MTDDELAERQKQAQLAPARINPFMLSADQQGWRGVSLPGAAKRKIYTVLHNEQVLVTAMVRLPEDRALRPSHYHDSGELSIQFEGGVTPIIGWSPPGPPHLHAPPRNPAAELRALLRQTAQDGDPNQETTRFASQLGQMLQIPGIAEWLESIFKPQPEHQITQHHDARWQNG